MEKTHETSHTQATGAAAPRSAPPLLPTIFLGESLARQPPLDVGGRLVGPTGRLLWHQPVETIRAVIRVGDVFELHFMDLKDTPTSTSTAILAGYCCKFLRDASSGSPFSWPFFCRQQKQASN